MGGMKAAAGLFVLLLLFQQPDGCDQSPKPTPPAAKESRLPPLHRFENVSSPASPGIALDTVTGQYCKTWDWTYKTPSFNGGLDTVPTCLSIFQSTPSSPIDPLGVLDLQK
jgi:hypothetical protein